MGRKAHALFIMEYSSDYKCKKCGRPTVLLQYRVGNGVNTYAVCDRCGSSYMVFCTLGPEFEPDGVYEERQPVDALKLELAWLIKKVERGK